MKEPLFLMDGFAVIFRSYFAFMRNPLTTPDGRNTSAVFGVLRAILQVFQKYNPEYFAFVMDSPVKTFRHEKYPAYKANRDAAPDDLHPQIPIIKEVLSLLKVPVINLERYEADDLMATYATRCREEGRPCYLITGDKDLLQLCDDSVKVLKPDKGGFIEMGKGDVEEVWGVRPEQILDFLSLIGDSSDNVPGVKGIGPKTAEKLLREYDTLEGVYEHLGDLSGKMAEKLENDRENAFLSKELITLECDAPVPWQLNEFAVQGLDGRAALPILVSENLRTVSRDLGVPDEEFLEAFQELSGGGPEATEDGPRPNWAAKGEYEAVTDIDSLGKMVATCGTAGRFSFDIETDSINEMLATPVGFSFSCEMGKGWYVPLVAGGKRYLDDEVVREAIRPLFTDPELVYIGQNIKYDYKVLKRWGIRAENASFDTMIAAWLLDTTAGSYGMDALAETHLDGYQTVHFEDVVEKGKTFDTVPLDEAVGYAAEDADITFRLYLAFEPQLKAAGLSKLFKDVEMPLVSILADMEMEGITLVADKLEEYGKELEVELQEMEKRIHEAAGKEFNINSTKQLQEVLFEDLGLNPVKKTKTGYSTDVKVLEQLSYEHEVPALILQNRSMSKLKSTYVDALPKEINPRTGRVHTRLIQTGTATGRIASRDPNLQNIPVRDEAGRRIRHAFVPGDGKVFVSADYSQLELVVLAHLSGDEGLSAAFRDGRDVHRLTASKIFGASEDEVDDNQRRIAKTINFGVMYGMSAFRLSNELKIPRKDASDFIKAYFTEYAGIRDFIDATVEKTEKSGYTETLLGRRRPVPGITSKNHTEKAAAERVAVNTAIQGTGADIVKLAMMAIAAELPSSGLDAKMILQIHDELLFEVAEKDSTALEDLVRREMEGAIALNVPLRVGVESGETWGSVH